MTLILNVTTTIYNVFRPGDHGRSRCSKEKIEKSSHLHAYSNCTLNQNLSRKLTAFCY